MALKSSRKITNAKGKQNLYYKIKQDFDGPFLQK